ncbi:MAG: alpha-glucosidase/alpha-galactosidase [Lachnospiraceae bacterium]
MKYENNKMTEVKIAYIGGGSRGWAWTFMTDLALEDSMSGTIRLYDTNKDAARHNEIIGNHLSKRDEAVGKWNYETVDNLKEALSGIDFVVISILPGGFEEMWSDVHLPEEYGIYQSVGDTVGPGGAMRSLRTIPMFVEIANAVREYAPNAWVINYTNPMSLCVKTLYETFPEIKAFGCCHEVFGTQSVLKGILEEQYGYKNIDRHDILVNVLGINHFTWFDYASYKGLDLFTIYKKYVKENFEKGYDDKTEHWANKCFSCKHRVKFDLYNKYGLIAAAGDRHLAEFVDGEIYLKDPETVESWGFGLTSVDWRIQDCKERMAKSERLMNFDEEVKLDDTGEEGILLIKALCGLIQIVSNVNIPNYERQIENLPGEAIVETNALFRRDSIRPILAGKVPDNIQSLILPHIKNHDRLYEASTTYNKELVVQSFMEDPLIHGRLTEAETRELVNDMIQNTINYLPQGWKNQ